MEDLGLAEIFFFRWQMLEAKCYNEDTFTKNLRTLSACPWVSGTETVGNLCELSTATCNKSYLRSPPGGNSNIFYIHPQGNDSQFDHIFPMCWNHHRFDLDLAAVLWISLKKSPSVQVFYTLDLFS